MNHNRPVPLERRFSPVPRSEHVSDERQILEVLGNQSFKRWPEMDQRYRSVILAEAGAGKTFEMIAHAEFIEAQGSPRFSSALRISLTISKKHSKSVVQKHFSNGFHHRTKLGFFSTQSMKHGSPIQKTSKRLYVNLLKLSRRHNCEPISVFPVVPTPGDQSLTAN